MVDSIEQIDNEEYLYDEMAPFAFRHVEFDEVKVLSTRSAF